MGVFGVAGEGDPLYVFRSNVPWPGCLGGACAAQDPELHHLWVSLLDLMSRQQVRKLEERT